MPDNITKLTGDALINDIVDNPEKYGFTWGNFQVREGDMGPWDVPLPRHDNLELLRTSFGDHLFMAKTSRHVTNQRIARDIMSRRPLTNARVIKVAIVQNMLGIRSRAVAAVKTYLAGGQEFATRELAETFLREALTAKGYPADLIEDVIKTAIAEKA